VLSATYGMQPPAQHVEHVRSLMQLQSMPNCTCDDPKLCRPLYRPAGSPGPARDREVFGFVSSSADYQHYDWSQVSTVAWGSSDALICEAHAHGARVVMSAPVDGSGDFPKTQANRDAWVESTLKAAVAGGYDGITFDFESPIAADDHSKMGLYLALINQTSIRFHAAIPGSQVSVCVAWSPDDIDGRAYDYVGLSAASDLLYLMVYDTRSQIYGQCIASANAPSGIVQRAIQRYTDIGIAPSKMVLGLPWYGYDYPCQADMADPLSPFCPIAPIPFRGVNCSDAAGSERAYADLMRQLQQHNGSTTGRRWDAGMQTPYFNYRSTKGTLHQVGTRAPASSYPAHGE